LEVGEAAGDDDDSREHDTEVQLRGGQTEEDICECGEREGIVCDAEINLPRCYLYNTSESYV